MFRCISWLARPLWPSQPAGDRSAVYPRGAGGFCPGQLVTVRLADGRLVPGERAAIGGEPAPGQHPTLLLTRPADGPRRPRRRWYALIPRWLRWTAALVAAVAVFRRIVAWALLAALSAALHLVGVSVGLPPVTFGWPWSPASAAASTTLVGPLVLQKIQGIDQPALGTETFDFMFTRTVSKSMGFLPCWYSGTFSAVGHASATVDLNPGASWWKPSAGHYGLRVLSQPSGSTPGQAAVTMALPLPRLPQSVHDVAVDDTLSAPVSSSHSWTYPGLGCGVLLRPQFSPSVLYAQAQQEAFMQATTVTGVTQPLIAAAEKAASTIIGGNFVTPALNALGYHVSRFTIRWVAPGAAPG